MIIFPVSIMMMDDDDDRSFMEKLYIQYRHLMFRKALKIVEQPQNAEDVVSAACESLIENVDTLRKLNVCKLRAYIVSTVRNASVDFVRKRNRQGSKRFLTDDEKAFDIPDETPLDEEMIRKAEAQMLRQALQKISKSERELLKMKYFDLASDAEIAEAIGIGVNSVRYYLTKARRSLRRILEESDFL